MVGDSEGDMLGNTLGEELEVPLPGAAPGDPFFGLRPSSPESVTAPVLAPAQHEKLDRHS